MNLCVNARDAMPQGGRLAITVHNETCKTKAPNEMRAGPCVLIEVKDTGQGIPAEHFDRIFDPFFTTKGPGAGTGLGLSTVSAIVTGHGGFVEIESSVGVGTTFKVYIPALAPETQADSSRAKTNALSAGDGETILVVEDEAAVRDLTRIILENCGYTVLVAADGAEGAAMYSRNPKVGVVLTDLDMPGMGGAEMIRAIQEVNPAVKVISASGLIGGHEFGQTVNGPVRAVLQKPFSPAELLRTLRDVLKAQ